MTLRARVAAVRRVAGGHGRLVRPHLARRAADDPRARAARLRRRHPAPRLGRRRRGADRRRAPTRASAGSPWTSSSSTSATTAVAVGDEVVVFGDPATGAPTADEWAAAPAPSATRSSPASARASPRATSARRPRAADGRCIADADGDGGARRASSPPSCAPATSCCSTARSARARPRSPAASATASACAGPVQSPTFVLARTHPNLAGGPPLVHVDAYRLGSAARARRPRPRLRPRRSSSSSGAPGSLDDVADSWLEVVIERPDGCAGADGVDDDAADAELLGADEPRVLEVRGYGPRWAGSPFAAAPVGWTHAPRDRHLDGHECRRRRPRRAACSPRRAPTTPCGTPRSIGGFIRDALAAAGVRPRDLSGVAGGMGPGPFTGLRVGIAAAHAFALGIGRPFVPVVSHDAVAWAWYRAGGAGRLQVVTDARRREFAVSDYDGLDDDGLPVPRRRPRAEPARRRARRRRARASTRTSCPAAADRHARRARVRRGPAAARRRRAALPARARRDARRPASGCCDERAHAPREASTTSTRSCALERATFATDAWSEDAMRRELEGPHGYYLVAVDDDAEDPERRLLGLRGPARARRAAARATSRPSPSPPFARGIGLGRGLMHALITQARRRARRASSSSRCAPTTRSRGRSTTRSASSQIGVRRGYYQPDDVDADRRCGSQPSRPAGPGAASGAAATAPPTGGAAMNRDAPLVLGIETSLRRDRHRHRARHDAARQRHRLVDGGARPLRRRRARGRGPRAPRGARARRSRRRSPRPTSTLADLDAVAVTSGPGLAGALMVGRRRGQGARARARQADLRRQPPRRPCRRRPPRRRGAARDARPSRCSSRAATRRCCSCATSSPTSSCSARPSTTPRARRSTRSRGCSACRTPAAPRSTARRIGGDPTAIRFPRGLTLPKDLVAHRYDFSFSGLKTAVARWVEQREAAGEPVPSPTSRRASARPSSTCSSRKAVAACTDLGVPRLLLGGGVVANARLREVAAASGRMPRASRCASRRCRSAPTTAR